MTSSYVDPHAPYSLKELEEAFANIEETDDAYIIRVRGQKWTRPKLRRLPEEIELDRISYCSDTYISGKC